MIINESKKDNYEELEIVNPNKFISAMGGITENLVKEAEELSDKDSYKQQMMRMLQANNMSSPPTYQEISRSDNKIKIPWYLVGVLGARLHDYGLKKKKE